MFTSLKTFIRARHSVRAVGETEKPLTTRFASQCSAHGVMRSTRLARIGLHAITALLVSIAFVCRGDELSEKGRAIFKQHQHAVGPVGRFEVINAGVGNYGTVQEVTYYTERGRAFHPDLVVLQYFINDAEPVPRETKSFLRDRSYFIAFAISRFDGILRVAGRRPGWQDYYASLYDEGQPGWRAAKMAFADLARQTKNEGTRLLVALLPELHQINGEYPFAREHALVRSVLAAHGVPTLELIDGLRGHGPESSLWVTPLDDHPNAKANGLIAAQTKRWILNDIR